MKSSVFADTGRYDEAAENKIRADITVWACYAESGPGYDPSGDYLCGTCNMRSGTDQCLRVGRPGEGPISFTDGTCRIYQIGEPLSDAPMPTKLTKTETGYTERPNEKGFGCWRCDYGAAAIAPDFAGRESWCSRWGCHVLPSACCDQNEGIDDTVRTIRPGLELILRQRIGRNLDRNPALTPARRAAILESEVAAALSATEAGKPLHVTADIERPPVTVDTEGDLDLAPRPRSVPSV